ncbi:TetR/AcrR family transcriptional regulator [Actinoplanes sp. M2I2]|uniref:TetR/AcrR family transcriptional regulator n=1 Tax=Actinoplanes sp. M2I2 TaxID=1734444 RepID=UPI00202141B1|nr:TetR/AcrR family transcriptional regulator [Actinoplanes sp. M2I2]
MGYHHGDLRAALIRASFDVLAETGLERFSVAAVARRLGVSSAAPYRHFPDRDHLLSAVSAAAADDLRAAIVAAVAEDPADGLAAAAGAYVRYVVRTGAGIQVIFAAELYAVADDDRRERTRALMTTMLELTGADARLLEATLAVAHGYASLIIQGFFSQGADTLEEIAGRAAQAARALR